MITYMMAFVGYFQAGPRTIDLAQGNSSKVINEIYWANLCCYFFYLILDGVYDGSSVGLGRLFYYIMIYFNSLKVSPLGTT